MTDPYRLPEELEVGGHNYKIRTDFRAILDILTAYTDPELDGADKTQFLIEIIYPDFNIIPPDCLEEAVKKAMWFIDAGLPPGDDKPKPVLMNWVKDGPIIIPEINKYVGKEVRSVEYMHWWNFFGAYMQIGGDGLYSQIQNIRQKRSKGKKLEKLEAEFYRENKALCDLDYEKNQAELEEVKKLFG